MNQSSSFTQYVNDARQLRASMGVNRDDSDYVNRGNSIVYFVDANVVTLFTDPKSNLHYLEPFSHWLDDTLLFSTSVLTAEFLFSGELPGQNKSIPTLITPDHYDDLQSMAGAIHKKGEAKASEITAEAIRHVDHRWHEIGKLIERYKANEIDPNRLLADLGGLLPQSIMDLLQGPLAEAQQLRRLIGNGGVVRADTMNWFDRTLFDPDPSLVADWVVLLKNAIQRSRDEATILRDARSVVQLLLLSKEARQDTRYVFVTNDAAIRIAYRNYKITERKAGRHPISLNLRRPREFAPLINLGAMSKNEQIRLELFPHIERALDELLIGVSIDDRGESPERTAEIENTPAFLGVASEAGGASYRNAGIRERIEQLRSWWAQAAEKALDLNPQYIANRNDTHFKSVVEVLSQSNVVDAALSQLRDVIQQLSNTHIRLSFLGIIARYLESAQKRVELVPEFGARRAPLQIKAKLFRDLLIQDISINDFLDELYQGTRRVPLDRLVETRDDGVSFLFAACVAIAAEDWKSASSFSERALTLIEFENLANEEALYEARYCRALAHRFSLHSEHELKKAKDLLSSCIDYFQKKRDQFGLIRSFSELASVLSVHLYKVALLAGPLSEQKAIDHLKLAKTWTECHENLKYAQELLDDVEITEEGRNNRLYQRLGLQIYTIKVSMAVYAYWVMPSLSRDSSFANPSQDLSELQDRIERWRKTSTKSDTPYTSRVYAIILEFITTDSENRYRIGTEAEELLNKLLQFGNQLADFDRAEYEFFLRQIAAAPR